jgi:regulatory protein
VLRTAEDSVAGVGSLGPGASVTALRADPRAPGYVIIEVNRARYASLPIEAVNPLGLSVGRELDPPALERLRHLGDVEASGRVAIRLLAARPRAVNELLRRLRERGHNPSAAAEAVGRLESKGILNDAEFARHFVRLRAERGLGRSRLLRDLITRGVDRLVAERAIDEVLAAEGVDALRQARALANRRAAQLKDLPADRLQVRLLGYLARRGFQGGEVRELVRQVVLAR